MKSSVVKNLVFLMSAILFLSASLYANAESEETPDVALRIEYAIGYSTVYYQDYKTIRSFAEVINRYPETQIRILGHTDSTGTNLINQELSDARAVIG